MKRDLSKFRRRLGLKLIGAAFILLGFAGMLQLMIRPNIMNVCEYNSRAVTVSLIDDAINERLTELGEDAGYSALVKLSYTADGRVSSIESNTKLINVDLTVGTLSGIPLFHGSGPTVRMKVEPKGYADAVFISEFTDAGINQTLHRMIMRTTVSVTAFIPMYSVQTDVSGDVPESFTHVVSEDKDIVDAINDFEAEPYE